MSTTVLGLARLLQNERKPPVCRGLSHARNAPPAKRPGLAPRRAAPRVGPGEGVVCHRHANASADIAFELLAGGVDLGDAACVAGLKETLRTTAGRFQARGTTLGLVVVDTLSRALPGCDENSAADMSRAVGALESLAEASDAFVLAVAHHGKGGGERGIRGWSGINAASDMTLTVTRDEADPSLRIVTLSKIKNAGDGADIRFRLKGAGTGVNDADGHEMQSCVCAFEPAPEAQDRDADAVVAAVRHAVRHFQSYAVAANLAHEADTRAVPTPAEEHRDRQIAKGLELALAVSADRDVEIVTKPR